MPGHTDRALTSDDFDAWWALRVRALTDHPEAFAQDLEDMLADGKEATREHFAATRSAGDNRIFGAFTGDRALVGLASIERSGHRKMRHRVEITGVYVAPEARGHSVGELLINACVEHARQTDGVLQVHIGVGTRNQTAVRLYQRCGFRLYGHEPRLLLLPDGTVTDEDLLVLMFDGYGDAVP